MHVICATPGGRLAMTLSDIPFVSTYTAGGAGIALTSSLGRWLFGPATMETGHITNWQ
jgi:hypothetical protein